jgi:hypothetical protein
VIEQLAPPVSATETVPVGVPFTAADTITDAVTGIPNKAGLGEAVMLTEVFSVNVTE